MGIQNFTIPNLFNGVSQQPITIRLPNQAAEQINANCRVTDGLSKRLGSNLIAAEKFIHPSYAYDLWMRDVDVKTFTIKGTNSTGNQLTVQLTVHCQTGYLIVTIIEGAPYSSFIAAQSSYLIGSKEDIKFLANGSDVYILNRGVIVTKTVDLTEAELRAEEIKQGSLVAVKQGFFGTRYRVKIRVKLRSNDSEVGFAEFNHDTAASTGADVSALQTMTIRDALVTGLNTQLTSSGMNTYAEILSTSNFNWFQVKTKTAYAATHYVEVEVFSSTASQAIFGINGSVTDYLQLPATGPTGYTVKVIGDAASSKDDYYLKYSPATVGWVETKRLGLNEGIDPTTLPIRLTGLFDLSISTAALPIKDREVGDKSTCPDPSFVNNKISDIFIFSNRLGFVSKNNIIMSRIDEYDVFYRTSVATTLSADRVDLKAAIPSRRYSDLNFVEPFDKEMIIFGDASQYSLASNTGFDTKVAQLQTLTEYEASSLVPPVNVGSSVYFALNRGEYSAIFDLSRKDNVALSADDVTQHVPKYIKGKVIEMVHNSVENMLFLRTNTEKRTIYVQNRFIRENIIEQNAWHKWVLPHDITYIGVVGSKLYVTMVAEDNISIIRTVIDVSLTIIEQTENLTMDFKPFLDNLKLLPEGSVITTGYAPYFVPAEYEDEVIGVNLSGGIVRGVAAINDALQEEDMWVGLPFNFEYTFSEQTPASYGTAGKTIMQYAKLTLRSMKISYQGTGKFNILLNMTGRASQLIEFTGSILGTASAILGKINVNTGVFKFPVNSRSDAVTIKIQSDYPYPCSFSTVEWQGTITSNAGRI